VADARGKDGADAPDCLPVGADDPSTAAAGPSGGGSAHVVLVGLMGSGKSTVGRIVAERLGRPLVDVDDVIASRTGRTVRELWREGGEDAYRSLESGAVLDTLAGPEPVVLAAPGGVIMDTAVRTVLADDGVVTVWLRAQVATLARRVQPDDHRPLLGEHPVEVLAAMAAERSGPLAEVSDLVIDIDELGAESVVDLVIGAMEPDLRP